MLSFCPPAGSVFMLDSRPGLLQASSPTFLFLAAGRCIPGGSCEFPVAVVSFTVFCRRAAAVSFFMLFPARVVLRNVLLLASLAALPVVGPVLLASRCVSFAVSLGGCSVSERDSKAVGVACPARLFSSCRGAVAAVDRACPEHVLRGAGLLGWEPKSSVAARECSEVGAGEGFFLLGEDLWDVPVGPPELAFSTCLL